ncbi:hypothetical protein ACHAWX_004346 [Stephanocyclus meneghinianus]
MSTSLMIRRVMLTFSCLLLKDASSFTAPTNRASRQARTSPASSSSSMGPTATVVCHYSLPTNPAALIDDVLQGNSTAAASIVGALTYVRGTDTMEQYLNDMMPPQLQSFPLWTRLPLATRYSRRARQFRLRRLIELSTPSPDNPDDDDASSKSRRERRTLFVLLRNIAENPENGYRGISDLLQQATRDAANAVILSSAELLKRTPDLETPQYTVLKTRSNGLEIRQYEPFAVCSVTMKDLNSNSGSDKDSASRLSNPQLSGAKSFGALAGYLFGENQAKKTMKMTTPVITEGEGDDKKMSFVLPSDYWKSETMSDAPLPLSDSAVRIAPVQGSVRGVLAFGGYGRKSDAMSKKLKDLLLKDGEWCAVENAPVVLAQYNDPFTPPWKRRNEVSVLVAPRVK